MAVCQPIVFLCFLFHYTVLDGCLSYYVVCSTTLYRVVVCQLIVFLCCLFHYTVQDGCFSSDCLSMLFDPLHCTGWLFVSRLSFYVVCSTTLYRMAVCHLIVFLCCLFHYTVLDGCLSFYVVCSTTLYRMAICHLIVFL